jgi:hypothetical protein
MKYIIGENRMSEIIHRVLNMEFPGFDDIYYDWANFYCGMGECCDPYAIGFTLPTKDYDDYLFKLIEDEHYDGNGDYGEDVTGELPEPCHEYPNIEDPRFDTYLFYEVFAEKMEPYLGPSSNWEQELLYLLNKTYRTNATNILII